MGERLVEQPVHFLDPVPDGSRRHAERPRRRGGADQARPERGARAGSCDDGLIPPLHERAHLVGPGARVLVPQRHQPLDVLLLERQVAQEVRAALLAHPEALEQEPQRPGEAHHLVGGEQRQVLARLEQQDAHLAGDGSPPGAGSSPASRSPAPPARCRAPASRGTPRSSARRGSARAAGRPAPPPGSARWSPPRSGDAGCRSPGPGPRRGGAPGSSARSAARRRRRTRSASICTGGKKMGMDAEAITWSRVMAVFTPIRRLRAHGCSSGRAVEERHRGAGLVVGRRDGQAAEQPLARRSRRCARSGSPGRAARAAARCRAGGCSAGAAAFHPR